MLSKLASAQRPFWGYDILGLSCVFLIFYALWLGSYPFFTPDEGRYSEVAREMLATQDFITPRVDGIAFLDKPVLHYWLQAAAIYLFGIKEWAIRLSPVLFGLLGTVLTYICTRKLFDRRSALLAATILMASPLYFCGAHYANLDLEVAVLISSSLLCFITAVHASYQRSWLLGAYVFAGLACLTKGLIGLVFPMMIIGLWIIFQWRWDLLKKMLLIPGLCITLSIALPWYFLAQKANPEFFHYFFVTQQITRFLSQAEFNNAVPMWFYLPIVLFGFFPWTIFLPQAFSHPFKINPAIKSIYSFFWIWIGSVFIFFSIPSSKAATYILPIFPALAIVTGAWLASHWHQHKIYWFPVLNFTLFSSLLAASLFSIPYYEWLDVASKFTPTLMIAGTIFLVAACAALFCLFRKNLAPLYYVCLSSSILFLITLIAGAHHLNRDSTKGLVAELKTVMQPQDEVITYFKYFQDLPLYLNQRIIIAADWDSEKIPKNDNWAREMWYGLPFQKADWLINEESFWKRWTSDKRIFVFITDNYLAQFRQRANTYFVLARNNDIYLLSNRAVRKS